MIMSNHEENCSASYGLRKSRQQTKGERLAGITGHDLTFLAWMENAVFPEITEVFLGINKG